MTDTTEREIQRGERARQLLQDELLQEAFATIEKGLTEQWQNSPVRDKEAREKLWLTLRCLKLVHGHLHSTLETGVMAKATLAQRVGQKLSQYF